MKDKDEKITKEEFNKKLKILEDCIDSEIKKLEKIEKQKYEDEKFLKYILLLIILSLLFKLIIL